MYEKHLFNYLIIFVSLLCRKLELFAATTKLDAVLGLAAIMTMMGCVGDAFAVSIKWTLAGRQDC